MASEAVLWMGLGAAAGAVGFMVVLILLALREKLTLKKHRAILRGSPTRDFKY